jgi:hypothetical protein
MEQIKTDYHIQHDPIHDPIVYPYILGNNPVQSDLYAL